MKANSHVDWVLHKSSIDSALRRKKKRKREGRTRLRRIGVGSRLGGLMRAIWILVA